MGRGGCEQLTAPAPLPLPLLLHSADSPVGVPPAAPAQADRRAQVCARGREGVRGGTVLWVLRACAVMEGTAWTRAVLRGTEWRRGARSATERAWDDG